jgi:uncharacterized protein (TIGR02246 family)
MKFLLIFLAGNLFAQSAGETAVREIVRKYVEARDKQDARAIEALFTTDADQLVSSGQWRKGREEVVRGTLASSQNETGKRTVAIESVRFLAPNVALADGRYEIGDRKMWSTFLITQDSNGWRIAAIRNMLPAK